MTKLTAGSDSLATYKKMTGKLFIRRFPILSPEIDGEIRKAYRGGFTYADPRYSKQLNGKGSVYDVNSLYPSVMRTALLPYGDPIYSDGAPRTNRPLYIASITFTAKLNQTTFLASKLKRIFLLIQHNT